MSALDYLVVGHVTRDVVGDDAGRDYQLGGTATFAAATARDLGCRVGVLTAASADLAIELEGIAIHRQRSIDTTTFENVYPADGGPRQQLLHARGAPLSATDVPARWTETPIVHLGPIYHEIDDELARRFSGAELLATTPQGWMRRQHDGRILPCRWHRAERLLSVCRVVILSREDVRDDLAQVERMAAKTEILVLTAGYRGATVYCRGEQRSFAAPPVDEVDPTGAGDIFAAAFLIELWRSADPWRAAAFANDIGAESVTRSRAQKLARVGSVDQLPR
jgi:sugar/nucleoside kinase (ribokinase family)